jgi:hypothetical protein
MSKGSGGGTQVQRSEPSTLQAPYLADLYQQAQQQFQAGPQQFFPDTTFARPSEETQLAELMLKDAALGQQTALSGSLFPAFQQQLMSPAQRFNDPLLQQSLAAGLRPYEESASRLLTQARRDAFDAGQGGGDRRALLESQVIGDYLTKAGDVASKFYGDIYGQGLEAQTRTLGLAPSIMDTFLSPARTIGAIGAQKEALEQKGINEAMQRFAFEQAAPERQLQTYSNLVTGGGLLPGTTTTTGPGTSGPGGLAGATGAAGLASVLAPKATFAGAMPSLFQTAIGTAGPQIPGALAGSGLGAINPYIAGAAILGGLLG